ncbi:MAG: hypothetical protein LBQ49_02535 [Rickettsiales bacterium]|jgi:hypothetical protein|nr:hypothetical protein [Rickettsiales bacterium]
MNIRKIFYVILAAAILSPTSSAADPKNDLNAARARAQKAAEELDKDIDMDEAQKYSRKESGANDNPVSRPVMDQANDAVNRMEAATPKPTPSCGSSETYSDIKKKCVATSSAPCDPGEEVKTDSGGRYCTKKSSPAARTEPDAADEKPADNAASPSAANADDNEVAVPVNCSGHADAKTEEDCFLKKTDELINEFQKQVLVLKK